VHVDIVTSGACWIIYVKLSFPVFHEMWKGLLKKYLERKQCLLEHWGAYNFCSVEIFGP